MERTMFEGLFQPTHLLLVMGIALIVMGPGKLSDVGSSLGKSVRDFRKAMQETDDSTPDDKGKAV